MGVGKAADFVYFLARGGKIPLGGKGISPDVVQVIIKVVNIAGQIKDKKRGWLNGSHEKLHRHLVSYQGKKAFSEKGARRVIEITCPKGHAFKEMLDFMDAYRVLESSDRSKRIVVVYVDETAKLELPRDWDR